MKKYAVVLWALLFALLLGSLHAAAMETGFSTRALTEKERETFLSNFEITRMEEEPQKTGISCFDVRENGWFAVGTEGAGHDCFLSVYDPAGQFQYGYRFQSYGTFCLEWDDANLNLYLVRSDTAVSLDPRGTITELRKVEDTAENNAHWNDCLTATEKKGNGSQYALKNNMGVLNLFATTHARLTRTDANGHEQILYDASAAETPKMIATVVFVLLFAAIVIVGIVKTAQNLQKKQRPTEPPAAGV